MGFSDSIRGLGRVLADVTAGAVQTLGPTFLQLGAQRLASEIFGTPKSAERIRQVFIPPPIRSTPINQPLLQGPSIFPGGGQIMPSFPQDRGGVTSPFLNVSRAEFDQPIFDIPGIDLQLPFRSEGTQCPTFFRQGGATMRAVREVQVIHPQTGKCITYRNMGRTLLFSGDVQAAKRVKRIARMAGVRRPR